MYRSFENYVGRSHIGSNLCLAAAFYVVIILAFVATGHTSVQDWPEPMCASGDNNFRNWSTAAKAILVTASLPTGIVTAPSIEASTYLELLQSLIVPLASIIFMTLLIAGVFKPSDGPGQEIANGTDVEDTEKAPPGQIDRATAKSWRVNLTLVYVSSRIEHLDFRLLLMGVAMTIFDILYNYQECPSPNFVSVSREVEPPILSLASVSLVGTFSYYNLLNLLGPYDQESGDYDSHSLATNISLWYAILLCVIMVNNTLVNRQADEAHPIDADPKTKDHLLVSLRFKVSTREIVWQLRNSHVFMVVASAYLSTFFAESWPLPINTTIASLLIFVAVAGFQMQPLEASSRSEDERSVPHQVVLALCALITVVAVALNHLRIFHPGQNWDFGTTVALVSHWTFTVVIGSERVMACFKRSGGVDGGRAVERHDEEAVPLPIGESEKGPGVTKTAE